jgi:hypothetical protein
MRGSSSMTKIRICPCRRDHIAHDRNMTAG